MTKNMLALLHFFLPILVSGGKLHCGSSICPVISANLEAILVSSILETIMNWIECSMSWFQDTRKILGCCTHDGCLSGHLKLSKIKRSRERSGIPPLLWKKREFLSCCTLGPVRAACSQQLAFKLEHCLKQDYAGNKSDCTREVCLYV